MKYTAKLQLLERGLVDAAQALDETFSRIKKPSGGEEGMDEAEEEESIDDYEKRIKLFVGIQFHYFPSRTRDHYKDSLVYQARKSLFADFLREVSGLKKCQNSGCRAYVHETKLCICD